MNLKVILLEGIPTDADIIVAKVRITLLSQFFKTGTVSQPDEEKAISAIEKNEVKLEADVETTVLLRRKKAGHLFMTFCNECSDLEEVFCKMNSGIEMNNTGIEDFIKKVELKESEIKLLQSEVEKAKLNLLLSKRELEILYFIASGKTTKEIAKRLFLSPATIATYRARLLNKLELKSNTDIVLYAIRNGLIK